MTELRTSYKLAEFLHYQKVNNLLPPELVSYLKQNNDSCVQLVNFNNQMDNIINAITKGDNPNEIIFRNIVKFYINTINRNNYNDYIQKIKKLDYSSKTCIQYLVSELIICGLSCPLAYKGYNLNEKLKDDTIPEICADVCKQISSFVISIDDKEVSFHSEFLIVCQKYFSEFMKEDKKMDEHNSQNADNFKGFMSFLGLLFDRDIIPYKVISICLTKIKNNIFTSEADSIDKKYKLCKHNSTEISNLYKGYEFLLNHVIFKLQNTEKTKNIEELVNNITEIHDSIKNNNNTYKLLDSKNELVNPLRPFYVIIHNKISEKINKIIVNFSL
jgi:cell fate (sporulation/competence/biofilm development) regulator YlbF (YheA/YmcA/DUF963 family)